MSNGLIQMNWLGTGEPEIGIGSESESTGLGIGSEWWPLELKLTRNRVRWTQKQPCDLYGLTVPKILGSDDTMN